MANKILARVLAGSGDANIRFVDLRDLLLSLGFSERTRGGHHIFASHGVDEIVNLQPKGSQAKPYQVKQVRNVILRYGLGKETE